MSYKSPLVWTLMTNVLVSAPASFWLFFLILNFCQEFGFVGLLCAFTNSGHEEKCNCFLLCIDKEKEEKNG